jgi:hypothetical protein
MTGSGNTIDSRRTGAFSAHGDDVARVHRVHVLTVVGVHLEQATDTFLVTLGRVQDVRAGRQGARVHAEVGELAHVRVGHDLEGECRERRALVGRTLDLSVRLQIDRRHRAYVEGRRQVVQDRVQERLDALVLE